MRLRDTPSRQLLKNGKVNFYVETLTYINMFSANFYLATQTGPLARALLACAVGARAYLFSGGTIAPLLREGACFGALHLARGRRGGGTAQHARARRRGAGSGARLARTSGPLRDLTPTHVGHTSCAASPRGTTPTRCEA